MNDPDHSFSNEHHDPWTLVHLREFKPLNVAFPAPGVYRRVILVLPPLEPSLLSRLTPSGAEPLTLMLDFKREVTANELLALFTRELDLLREIHSGAASPFNRSIFLRLHLSTNRERMGELAAVESPLDGP